MLPDDPSRGKTKNCSICKGDVKMGEGMECEKKLIHKNCFKCAFCSKELKQGLCSRDYSLEGEYGLHWWCKEHMTLDPSKKQEKLKKK